MEERKYKIGAMERYFIIAYSSCRHGVCRKANTTVKTTGGRYINRADFVRDRRVFNDEDIVIWNIIELSYEDFREYSR